MGKCAAGLAGFLVFQEIEGRCDESHTAQVTGFAFNLSDYIVQGKSFPARQYTFGLNHVGLIGVPGKKIRPGVHVLL